MLASDSTSKDRKPSRGREAPMTVERPTAIWQSDSNSSAGSTESSKLKNDNFLTAKPAFTNSSPVLRPSKPGSFLRRALDPDRSFSLQNAQDVRQSLVIPPVDSVSFPAPCSAPKRRWIPLDSNAADPDQDETGAQRDDSPSASSSSSIASTNKKPLEEESKSRRKRTRNFDASVWSKMNPAVMVGWMQATFNATLIAVVLYCVLQFVLTVRHDVRIKAEEQLHVVMSEIASCSKQYTENRCEPGQRVPAMESSCRQWETCMRRDPSMVGRARLSAEILAEIINGLVEPISYKTMMFLLAALFGTVYLSNYAFTLARHRMEVSSASNAAAPDLRRAISAR